MDWLSDERQQNRLMILNKFLSKASGLVLDCGAGEIEAKIICDSPNSVALDIASTGLKNLKKQNFAGQVIVASCTHLPLKDGVFERSICSEVIEHLPTDLDVKKCIRELERVSQIFMVTTPNNKFDFRWLERTHKRYFNTENIRKYLPNNARIMESDIPQYKAPALPLLPYFLLNKQHTQIGRYIAWFDNKLRKVPLCKLVAVFKTRPVGGAFVVTIVESRKKGEMIY